MVKLYDTGVFLVNQTEIIPDDGSAAAALRQKTGREVSREEAQNGTQA